MLGNKFQQGVSLYLSLMTMTILLAIALGLGAIFIDQTRMMKRMGNAVIAFYAADAGIEKVLTSRDEPLNIPETLLPNGATYQVFVTVGGVGNCPVQANYCIKSIGVYLEIRRAIEVMY